MISEEDTAALRFARDTFVVSIVGGSSHDRLSWSEWDLKAIRAIDRVLGDELIIGSNDRAAWADRLSRDYDRIDREKHPGMFGLTVPVTEEQQRKP